MAVARGDLFGWLDAVGNDNAAGEYYLPDIVNGRRCATGAHPVAIEGEPFEMAGVNSRAELAASRARLAAAAARARRWPRARR